MVAKLVQPVGSAATVELVDEDVVDGAVVDVVDVDEEVVDVTGTAVVGEESSAAVCRDVPASPHPVRAMTATTDEMWMSERFIPASQPPVWADASPRIRAKSPDHTWIGP